MAKYCPKKVQDIVRPYITRSSYYAHPELLLMASDQAEERRFAVNAIKGIRNGKMTDSSLPRKFIAAPVNFEAQCLTELIDWEKVPLSQPLLTATMTSEEVEVCMDWPITVPESWQCDSQDMERAVKKVSESCRMMVGRVKKEGWVRCAEASRNILKSPNTKADYEALFDLTF